MHPYPFFVKDSTSEATLMQGPCDHDIYKLPASSNPVENLKTFQAVVYLINRMPTPLHSLKSSFEVLFKSPPNYLKLRVFGCLCFKWLMVHLPRLQLWKMLVNATCSPCLALVSPLGFLPLIVLPCPWILLTLLQTWLLTHGFLHPPAWSHAPWIIFINQSESILLPSIPSTLEPIGL